jgi:hypothetical protein
MDGRTQLLEQFLELKKFEFLIEIFEKMLTTYQSSIPDIIISEMSSA